MYKSHDEEIKISKNQMSKSGLPTLSSLGQWTEQFIGPIMAIYNQEINCPPGVYVSPLFSEET